LIGGESSENPHRHLLAAPDPVRTYARRHDPYICGQADQALGRRHLQRFGMSLVDLLMDVAPAQPPVSGLEAREAQPEVVRPVAGKRPAGDEPEAVDPDVEPRAAPRAEVEQGERAG